MIKRFFPKEDAKSIFDISYDSLADRNITGLIFDVDNTLVPYDIKYPTDEVTALFERLRKMGFVISLLSNNNGERLSVFNEQLKAISIAKAGKPGSKGVERALCAMDIDKKNAVLIGDQIFTDIWCANRYGIYSVLVKPISKREEFFIKPKRALEKIVLLRYFWAKKSNIAKDAKKGYNSKGFTLTEIIIILAITALCMGVIRISLQSIGRRVLNKVCLMIQSDMRMAQRLSVIEGRRYKIEFDTPGNSYTVLQKMSGSVSKVVKKRQLDAKTKLLYVTGNSNKVEYTPTGTTRDACTVTLRDDNFLVNLTINVGSGRIEKKEFIKR